MDLVSLPKVELHCHLDGIVGPEIARYLCQKDPSYPVVPENMEKALPICGIDNFFLFWEHIKPIMGTLNYYYPLVERHIELLKKQNVIYAELMIAASDFRSDLGKSVENLSTFRHWVNTLEGGKIQIEFLITYGRNRPPELLESLVPFTLALHKAGLISGVAFASKEIGYPIKPFHNILAKYHDAGLGIEIHAGEWCGPESVWDALEYGFPDRIGHGTSLFQDNRLIEHVLKKQIHIEMCPTSNIRTGSINKIEDHPIIKARDLGLNFSINTDDPGPFQSSMLSEYELLSGVFGFTENDFLNIAANSLKSRFYNELRIITPALPKPNK